MAISRRSFIRTAGAGGLAAIIQPGSYPEPALPDIRIINPFNRVPVSLIIDDSTCLVNMAYYGIPQFAEVFPQNYKQDWRSLPREIPDSFVREFGEWCLENGVKGKYSVVPYPACTGWVSRFIPGWTRKELEQSLDLIRNVIVPNWDIHPEMVSHTRVVDIRTGLPFPHATAAYMENWDWSQDKSADELAAYQAYALKILREAGLYCEGITTPGGYGSRNQENLAISALQAVRDVYGAEIPHYFRDLFTEKDRSVAPRVLYPSGLDGKDPVCVVSIIGCTGDWFGGWDGLEAGDVNTFISEDLGSGRMVEVIDSGEPAIMVCHWPGIYFNGSATGFNILKEIKKRLHSRYDNLIWMKLSEIARYWAAKELTGVTAGKDRITFNAPFQCPALTVKIKNLRFRNPVLNNSREQGKPLVRVKSRNHLASDSWYSDQENTIICIDLEKGSSEILI